MTLTREDIDATIQRLEAMGCLDPACSTCVRVHYPAVRRTGLLPFAPPHQPSPRCESGQHPHCTCDTCF